MDERPDVPRELLTAVHQMSLTWVVRALMESHPDPERFRESWAHMLGMFHRDLVRDFAPHPEDLPLALEALRQIHAVWETYAPYSDAARSKPPTPPTDG